MSTIRTLTLIATFVALATGVAAQTPTTVAEPAPMPSMTPAETVQPVHDQEIFTHVIFSQLEGRFNGANSEFRWEGQGWAGTDYNKLWIKSEGTLQGNTLDDGQQQFLYSRAITTYFDLQGGLRSDLDSRPTRNWGAFGIQGLAPYFFDFELTGFASSEGHLAAKLEASYDLLLTQQLILQPQIELNLYSKADPARLVGAGFSDIDTELRLRYEFSRNFAPYLGIVYEGKFGQSASYARRSGESTGDFRLAFGLRLWF